MDKTETSKLEQRCFLCRALLASNNESREHILLAAIGGRKKTAGFLCIGCNNLTGKAWDAALAAQLNYLGLFVGIKRQRGKVNPPELVRSVSGKQYLLQPDGTRTPAKPFFEERHQDDKINISIRARTVDEAKQMVLGLKKKYPQIDAEEILSRIFEELVYDDEALDINMEIGGPLAGRSVVKSCLALAASKRIPIDQLEIASAYLKNSDHLACFGYYYKYELIVNRPNFAFHCVAISGDPENSQVLGYMELYGVFRIVCSLSASYSGPKFNESYAVNPSNGEVLNLEINLALSPKEVAATLNYEQVPDGAVAEAFKPILEAGLKRDFDLGRDKAVERAVRYAFANCGAKEGELLTQEHAAKLSRLVAEQIMPFIQRFLAKEGSARRTRKV